MLHVSHDRIVRLSTFDRTSQGMMNLLGFIMSLVYMQVVHGWLSAYERLVNSQNFFSPYLTQEDLSRFGREHLLCGHYTEIVYPTLGVNFIAIQENVDTTKGIGTEMMPFHNIFNEWYAAQTSKKIRAVNEMKASKGMRISSTVPYGYKKIEGDKEQWYIDEPAAEIVRKIFNLCISGKGPSQIARQLEAKKVLTPTAYFNSVGKKTSNLMPTNIYAWRSNSIVHILENRQYTGCTVNGKSTTVSYKVHKKIEKSQKDYQIISNTQDAIISENTWLRAQELRRNKRRNTATGRRSLFSGFAILCFLCVMNDLVKGIELRFVFSRMIDNFLVKSVFRK